MNQELHQYLTDFPPTGPNEDAIAEFLCTWRNPNNVVSPNVVSALCTWLRQSDNLVCKYILPSVILSPDDLDRLAGPLLCWGIDRPWGHRVHAKNVIADWCRALEKPAVFSDYRALNMAYATHQVVQLLPKLPEKERFAVAAAWCQNTMDTSPHSQLWRLGTYTFGPRALVAASWCDLHAIAEMAYGEGGTQMWEKAVHHAFANGSFTGPATLLTLLTSGLREDVKIRAAVGADAQTWLDPEVHRLLAPLYTQTVPEYTLRINFVPWTHGPCPEDTADVNRRICEQYCPELMAAFSLYPVDWNDRTSVAKVAKQHRHLSAQESFPVDGLLDIASPTR